MHVDPRDRCMGLLRDLIATFCFQKGERKYSKPKQLAQNHPSRLCWIPDATGGHGTIALPDAQLPMVATDLERFLESFPGNEMASGDIAKFRDHFPRWKLGRFVGPLRFKDAVVQSDKLRWVPVPGKAGCKGYKVVLVGPPRGVAAAPAPVEAAAVAQAREGTAPSREHVQIQADIIAAQTRHEQRVKRTADDAAAAANAAAAAVSGPGPVPPKRSPDQPLPAQLKQLATVSDIPPTGWTNSQMDTGYRAMFRAEEGWWRLHGFETASLAFRGFPDVFAVKTLKGTSRSTFGPGKTRFILAGPFADLKFVTAITEAKAQAKQTQQDAARAKAEQEAAYLSQDSAARSQVHARFLADIAALQQDQRVSEAADADDAAVVGAASDSGSGTTGATGATGSPIPAVTSQTLEDIVCETMKHVPQHPESALQPDVEDK